MWQSHEKKGQSEMAARIERATGKPTRFVELPLEQLRSMNTESANMY